MPKPTRPTSATMRDSVPMPSRYAHLHPDDGACLMEAVSLLAGGRFTDSPRCTHPALATLARMVNDCVGDSARPLLWPLAADLSCAYPAGRDYAPWLVGMAVQAARETRPDSRLLEMRQATCARRAARLAGADIPTPLGPFLDRLWWRGPGRHHLEHALRVLARAPDAERRLIRLLHTALSYQRPVLRTPPSSGLRPGAPQAHEARARRDDVGCSQPGAAGDSAFTGR
ncbi:hypothetical protein [Streptomyces carpinensis]|uniref:Uncharacterized protein n=1 Tax=Streptomyces carpinensis TaxID=66369 RepID=A0ABV1W0J4_9ACTN|nr:hypothetical protein [Streptomyces carpinensis]